MKKKKKKEEETVEKVKESKVVEEWERRMKDAETGR